MMIESRYKVSVFHWISIKENIVTARYVQLSLMLWLTTRAPLYILGVN